MASSPSRSWALLLLVAYLVVLYVRDLSVSNNVQAVKISDDVRSSSNGGVASDVDEFAVEGAGDEELELDELSELDELELDESTTTLPQGVPIGRNNMFIQFCTS